MLSLDLPDALVPLVLPGLSLVGVTLAALVLAALANRTRRSAKGRDETLRGALAVVTTRIPAVGTGAIAARSEGRRVLFPARAHEASAIAPGTTVVVVSIERGAALVTPFELGSEDGVDAR